jgi:hypothetical protein
VNEIHNPDTCTDQTHTPLGQAEAARDGAYRERAHLVALLAAQYPSWCGVDADAPDWPVVYVELPTGQCGWHISPDDWAELFAHLSLVCDDGWDGHSTEEKYRRIDEFARQLAKAAGR